MRRRSICDLDADGGKAAHLHRALLGIAIGSSHGRDDRRTARRAGLQMAGEMAGGIGVAAVADNAIEQDHAAGGVVERRSRMCVADCRLDHRVRPADRECVVTEIDDDVAACDRIGSTFGAGDRCVGRHCHAGLTQDHLRLGCERAAGKQSTDGGAVLCRGGQRVHLRDAHRKESSVFQRAGQTGIRLGPVNPRYPGSRW